MYNPCSFDNYNYFNMDAVLTQFENTVINPNQNAETKNPFAGMYKYMGQLSNQEQRRQTSLIIQKSQRGASIDACRGILNVVNTTAMRKPKFTPLYTWGQTAQLVDLQANTSSYQPRNQVPGFTSNFVMPYKNVLMMSEWMVERPEDFHSNWYVVPCPKGSRVLVVTHKGNTKFYNRHGCVKFEKETALPGGNRSEFNRKCLCVILDGFYVETLNTVYIIDILAWNNQPMTNCETEFRYFWLKSQFQQLPETKYITSRNEVLFELLPKIDCDPLTFNHFMMTVPHFNNFLPALDGLLFYHKLANYVSGQTPLVGWLYPYMVNEVLGDEITVHPSYILERPIDYINQAIFIEQFAEKRERKKIFNAENARPQRMETSSGTAELTPAQTLMSLGPFRPITSSHTSMDTGNIFIPRRQ
ncbi:snurportin-1 isoform X2 [Anticarsia gemmatalis]|uniref:snurportin-1 isoform X2 n=1 Tax=Anticarsia gemmatalis TaxID=129554 RepID=UPI003F778267